MLTNRIGLVHLLDWQNCSMAIVHGTISQSKRMSRVQINRKFFDWALERSKKSAEELVEKNKALSKLEQWRGGELSPTLRQLEDFAEKTHVPLGYFFLSEPPDEEMPITDFRTIKDAPSTRPSGDLLDTIYTMQRRQDWLSGEMEIEWEADALDFVGSFSLQDNPWEVGKKMRSVVDDKWTRKREVGYLRECIEQIGVMAVINGVVGNYNNRKLSVEEFRGFALVDKYAPLIFVNGADSKTAQMFTLAHELAHIFLEGGEGISRDFPAEDNRIEKFCNQAAAEFLVPAQELKDKWPNEVELNEVELFELIVYRAKLFKVNPIVIGRRAMDLRLITQDEFSEFYEKYTKQEQQLTKRGASGGDFYKNQNFRIGKFFARAVIHAAMEGRLGFRDAYRLTDLHGATLQKYALQELGIEMNP